VVVTGVSNRNKAKAALKLATTKKDIDSRKSTVTSTTTLPRLPNSTLMDVSNSNVNLGTSENVSIYGEVDNTSIAQHEPMANAAESIYTPPLNNINITTHSEVTTETNDFTLTGLTPLSDITAAANLSP